MAYPLLAELKRLIKNENFNQLAKSNPFDWMEGTLDTSLIIACKHWLIKNKGKYKLDNSRFWYL